MVSKLAKLSGAVLERDALSVNEMLVLVLVQVSATAKLPPRLRVVFEVLNEAPLANVAPIGRLRVPPVEERVPEVALIPPLRDKSAAPVTIFSPVLFRVTGCPMLNPAIPSSSVRALLAKSSVPTDREPFIHVVSITNGLIINVGPVFPEEEVTEIAQFEYVPSGMALKVIVLLPAVAKLLSL